ncbi:hypothetical protein [Virgibacillus ndiopensis]|uniref:hypothetical protein n=1 Tax=Virgibacillus ndiopensis TaxID=2004408 RepID=UPI00159BA6CD|nr:hypothetical protein [Virgibacillus ndiopensis]
MSYEHKIKELEDKITRLESNKIMENLLVSNIPDWTISPLNKVKAKGIIPYSFKKGGVD